MKTLLTIATVALSMAGAAAAPSAQAQPRFEREARWQHWDDRDRRAAYRGDHRRGYRHTWRDDHGRLCYRRSDGVRRCNADRGGGYWR